MDSEITIINAKIFDLDHEKGFWPDGFVDIAGGRIRAIGSMADRQISSPEAKIIDAHGFLVMPGLVNGHNHGAMTLFRGLADDLPLMEWLEQHIFPAEARFVNSDMVYWTTKLAAAEMILAGITTVADAYFFEDEAARAFVETGMRSVAAHGVIDFPAPGVPDPAENVNAVALFLERWQDSDLLTPAVFAHSPYTCSSETLIKAKELARKYNAPFFIHLAETEGEKGLIAEKWNGSPASYLASLDILDRQTVCVHSVWLDEDDIALIAQSGASVVSCPESNMKLAAGVAPLVSMRRAGIRVGLGTDGCASNNNLDLFAEMDICAKLHKVQALDATVLPAREVLRMATEEGARALGLADTGMLSSGKCADLIIIDLDSPHLTPFFSVDNLVYGAKGADVQTVIINGKLVMHERKIMTFDLDETMAKVTEMAQAVKDAVKL